MRYVDSYCVNFCGKTLVGVIMEQNTFTFFCKNLVVIRTPVRPSRACHNITSVHRIRADLKDRRIEHQLRSDLYNQELNICYKYF